jgi:flagellar basal body-associated protein FliL
MPATATDKRPRSPQRTTKPTTAADGQPGSPAAPGKRPLVAAGLVAVIVLLAYGAFQLAAPRERLPRRFAGPFSTELFPEKYQVNLAGSGMKRFLQLTLSVIYESYNDAYFLQRTKDPLYEPYLQSSVLAICSTKTVDEVQGRASQDALMEELREELDPILFPVHVGETKQALALDPRSGLRPGLSADRATFRGAFHDHRLIVDGARRTLRLGEGPPVAFTGNELDLIVTDAGGETLSLDTTGLVAGFSGEVPVGTHGRIRRVLPKYFLVQ